MIIVIRLKTTCSNIVNVSPFLSRTFVYGLLLLLFILKVVTALDVPTSNSTNGQIFPPCRACKILVGSFMKGMERTARGKFEGGDANWEETDRKSG